MPVKKLSEADRQAIRKDFAEHKTATLTLARRYRVTSQTIRNVLNVSHNFYKDDDTQAAKPAGTWANLDKDERRKQIEALLADGLDQKTIAKQLSISEALISLILKGER